MRWLNTSILFDISDGVYSNIFMDCFEGLCLPQTNLKTVKNSCEILCGFETCHGDQFFLTKVEKGKVDNSKR